MIHDLLNNSSRYKKLDLLNKYLENVKKIQFQKGKFEINKDIFFGIGLEYVTKNENECLWEAHKKYLDVHVILEGEETINIAETNSMKPTMEFDSENDYQLFTGKKQQTLLLKKGAFLALYPNECHQTSIQSAESNLIRKIVFKIEL